MPTPKNNTINVKKSRENLKLTGKGEKIEITGLTEKDKNNFRKFKKDSGIDKNSDAFRKLIEIANFNDNQKYFIV